MHLDVVVACVGACVCAPGKGPQQARLGPTVRDRWLVARWKVWPDSRCRFAVAVPQHRELCCCRRHRRRCHLRPRRHSRSGRGWIAWCLPPQCCRRQAPGLGRIRGQQHCKSCRAQVAPPPRRDLRRDYSHTPHNIREKLLRMSRPHCGQPLLVGVSRCHRPARRRSRHRRSQVGDLRQVPSRIEMERTAYARRDSR